MLQQTYRDAVELRSNFQQISSQQFEDAKFCAARVQRLTRYSHLFFQHKQMNPQIKLFSNLLKLKTTHCLTSFESQSNDKRLLSFSIPCCITNRPHSKPKREISDTNVTRCKRRLHKPMLLTPSS